MRPEYLSELARIHEPPEMSGKPMQVKKSLSPIMLRFDKAISSLTSIDKATHAQRAATIHELLEILRSDDFSDPEGRRLTYGAIATIACLDGDDPRTVIGYASNAIGEGGDALALRARMYLKANQPGKSLDDLEKIMVDDDGRSLVGGDVDPRKASNSCGWSIADFESFGNDPRALAAKGLYLASFLAFGAGKKGIVEEANIRDLYTRAAITWHSPVPHYLATSLTGLGSEHMTNQFGCIRADVGGTTVPDIVKECAQFDEGTRARLRELTMALVIDPTFTPALAKRANEFLTLAEGAYADAKPSHKLFELAVADFSAAIKAGNGDAHELYCDRALALASLGRYEDAIAGYVEGMKHAKGGVESSPFVHQQLARLYMKVGRLDEAAKTLTLGIMNSSSGGIDYVIVVAGMKAFRSLYPEYDLLPDELLAETVRRKYEPQFPRSWDAEFISKGDKVASSILPDFYILRGDAYMKAGRRAEALAEYQRVKSGLGMEDLVRLYFTPRGDRDYSWPQPWPMPPRSS